MVPLNYNFMSTCVYTHGTTRFYACKMLKSRVETVIYTRRGRVIYTRHEMPRHNKCYYTRRGYCFYIQTPGKNRQESVTAWAYGYTGNCITRGITILYFQFTLYIAGIITGIVRSQLLRRYVQPEPICQPSGLALITFFKTVYST